MNRGELVARAGRTMGMARSESDSVDEVLFLQQLAQEAVLDILVRTKIHVRRTDLALTAGVVDYDLSQQVLRLWSLFDEAGNELTEVESGDVTVWPGHVFQFVGYNMLIIGWEPEAGDTLEALYTPRPADMVDDNNDPAVATYGLIPEEFHHALVNFMCWKAGEATRDQMSGMGEKFRRQYEGEDGMGSMGTDLGRIKWAVNRRGATGSAHGRLRRMGQASAADLGSGAWR